MTGSDWNFSSQDQPGGGPPPPPPPPGPQYPAPGPQYPPPGPQQYPPPGPHPSPGGQPPPPGQGGQGGGAWAGPGPTDTVEFSSAGHGAPAPKRKRVLIAGIAAAVVVVVIAVVAIAVTGGSNNGSQTPAQVLADAAHKAASVSTLSATFSEKISGLTGGSINASVQEVRKPLQMSMTMTESIDGQTIPLSAVLTQKAMYMKFGSAQGLPKAMIGKWIEFPLTGLGGGEFATLLQSVQNENPASQAQLLVTSKHLRAAGKQVIAGVETTKYVGSFTPSTALKALPASERNALAPALKQVNGDIHFTVWIDGSDQIRQFVDVETVAGESVTSTFTFDSFNQPLTIKTPPPSQVTRIPSSALSG
jgi:hypothetical protein